VRTGTSRIPRIRLERLKGATRLVHPSACGTRAGRSPAAARAQQARVRTSFSGDEWAIFWGLEDGPPAVGTGQSLTKCPEMPKLAEAAPEVKLRCHVAYMILLGSAYICT
jgi:hypothetical protein